MSEHLKHDGASSLQPLRREERPSPEDAPAAALFAQVHPLDPLPDLSVARIRRRLETQLGHQTHARFPTWLKATVAVAASILVFETAAAATLTAWPALRERVWLLVAAHLPLHREERPPIQEPLPDPAPAPSVAPAASTPAPAESTDAVAPPVPAATLHTPRHRATPAAVAGDQEVELYSRALAQLNVAHDPTGALGTLSIYRFRHPNGLFRREVAVAEIRADMMLGRDAEALSLLDAMQEQHFEGVTQSRELGLLRVELLTRAGRCKEALPVLDPYLRSTSPSGDRERALFSRASCRAQLHDAEGSRKDLRDYLREFPQGRFAAKARQAVDSLP